MDHEPRHAELAVRGNIGHCVVCPLVPQSTTYCRGVPHVVVGCAGHPSAVSQPWEPGRGHTYLRDIRRSPLPGVARTALEPAVPVMWWYGSA